MQRDLIDLDYEDDSMIEDFKLLAYESYNDNNIWEVISSADEVEEASELLTIVRSDIKRNYSDKDSKLLESISNENFFVRCMDILKFVENVDLRQSLHFPIQTYYRLFIPLALPEYEKILYLDSDMCVFHDVAELYDYDLAEYVVGTVRDVPCIHLDLHAIELGDLDCNKTFKSGVLLMNTRKFEEYRVREQCLELLSEDYKRDKRKLIYADNDALNIIEELELIKNYFCK